MPSSRWTWERAEHPDVLPAIDTGSGSKQWCDAIETAPTDAVVGKVLCVCIALGIAGEVIATQIHDATNRSKAAEPLELLEEWIDSPTEERSQRICTLLYDENQEWPDNLDPHGVVWWTLRVAMSSVGNHEAGWALRTVCSAADKSGFDDEKVRSIARRSLLSRVVPE